MSLNNKIVLIYPIPEAGWDIPRKLFNNRNFNDRQTSIFNNAIGTVSYSKYKIRSEDSFKLLNQIGDKNIFRIYPHKITCNNIIKDRCLLYDLNNIYYIDDNHPSLFFSKLIALELINVIYKTNNY